MDPTIDSRRRRNRPRGTAAQVGPREEERAEARRDEHTSGTRTETIGRMADLSAEAVPWTTYLWWGDRHVGSSSFLFFTLLCVLSSPAPSLPHARAPIDLFLRILRAILPLVSLHRRSLIFPFVKNVTRSEMLV